MQETEFLEEDIKKHTKQFHQSLLQITRSTIKLMKLYILNNRLDDVIQLYDSLDNDYKKSFHANIPNFIQQEINLYRLEITFNSVHQKSLQDIVASIDRKNLYEKKIC